MTDMELPLGFGMALAMNESAMKAFELKSEDEKKRILSELHNINSKNEMQSFVKSLGTKTF